MGADQWRIACVDEEAFAFIWGDCWHMSGWLQNFVKEQECIKKQMTENLRTNDGVPLL